jgi:hypothetical protein
MDLKKSELTRQRTRAGSKMTSAAARICFLRHKEKAPREGEMTFNHLLGGRACRNFSLSLTLAWFQQLSTQVCVHMYEAHLHNTPKKIIHKMRGSATQKHRAARRSPADFLYKYAAAARSLAWRVL